MNKIHCNFAFKYLSKWVKLSLCTQTFTHDMEINFPIYDSYLKLIFGMGHMQQDERCSASQCVSMNSFQTLWIYYQCKKTQP